MKKILLSLAVISLTAIASFPATYTTNLNLKKPAHGEDVGTWDQAINNNMDIIDASVAILPVDLGSDVTGTLGSQHMVSTAVFTTIQNTFTDQNNFQTITGTSVSITGPLNISTLPANQCVQTGTGGLLTVTGSACGGGGASPSTMETIFGTERSSPTATLKGQTGQFTGSVSGSTMTFALDSSSVTLQGQNVIKLSNTLQANSTFYVSSGTVAGQLSANKVIASTLSITGDATIDALRVTGSSGLKVDTLTSGQCVQAGTGGLLTVTGAACGTGSGGGVVVPSTFTWGTVAMSTVTAQKLTISKNNLSDFEQILYVTSPSNVITGSHIKGIATTITGSTETAEVMATFAHASGTTTVNSYGTYGFSSAYGPIGYGGFFGSQNATTNYGLYVSTGSTRLASLNSKSCLGTDSNGVIIEGSCSSVYPATSTILATPYGIKASSVNIVNPGGSLSTDIFVTPPGFVGDQASYIYTKGDYGSPQSFGIFASTKDYDSTFINASGILIVPAIFNDPTEGYINLYPSRSSTYFTLSNSGLTFPNGTTQSTAYTGGGGGGGYNVEPATVTFNLAKGFTASTGTITGADGLSVTYGVTAGSLTLNGTGNPSFIKSGESTTYQIVGTSVVPTAGQCAVFTSSMSVHGITCPTGGSGGSLSGGTTNYAMCWLSATTAGHCMSAVGSNGSCTCIANQSAPLSPTITAVYQTTITVSWTQVASDLGYTAQASSTNYNGTGTIYSSNTINGSATSLVIGSASALTENTTYYLRVGSLWNDGTTTYANTVPASTTTLASGSSSAATYTFIQQTSNNTASNSGNLAFPSNVTAHSTLIVGCAIGNATGNPSVTDTRSNTYYKVTGSTYAVGGIYYSMWYTLDTTAGANTVTCADSGTGTWVQISILEYGTSAGGTYDVGSQSNGTSATASCGSVTTTATDETVIAFGLTPGTVTSQNGNLRVNYVNNAYVGAEDATVASPGSYSSTMTTGSSNNWSCIQGAFK